MTRLISSSVWSRRHCIHDCWGYVPGGFDWSACAVTMLPRPRAATTYTMYSTVGIWLPKQPCCNTINIVQRSIEHLLAPISLSTLRHRVWRQMSVVSLCLPLSTHKPNRSLTNCGVPQIAARRTVAGIQTPPNKMHSLNSPTARKIQAPDNSYTPM